MEALIQQQEKEEVPQSLSKNVGKTKLAAIHEKPEHEGKSQCFRCGRYGHHSRNCKGKVAKCFNCGKFGHISSRCRKDGKDQQLQAVPSSQPSSEGNKGKEFISINDRVFEFAKTETTVSDVITGLDSKMQSITLPDDSDAQKGSSSKLLDIMACLLANHQKELNEMPMLFTIAHFSASDAVKTLKVESLEHVQSLEKSKKLNNNFEPYFGQLKELKSKSHELKDKRRCHQCGKMGHKAHMCQNGNEMRICRRCGKPDHIASQCERPLKRR